MTRDYDNEAKDHPEHRYAYDFDYRMHGYMLRTFEPFLAGDGALELGCFQGNFTRLLCERFSDVDVVDASLECVEQARENVGGRARFFHATFQEFEPTRRYSNIFLVHTLEHLDDRVDVLKRIGSWLAPRGRLFVATPNARAASRQIAVNMGLIANHSAVTAAERAHGHRITYAIDTLSEEIRAAGFGVYSRGGIFFKGLANFQLDAALKANIISPAYLEAAYQLGYVYPDLCSSIYCVCERSGDGPVSTS